MQQGRVYVLGIGFNLVTRAELIDYIVTSAAAQQQTVIGHVNAHAMNLAVDQPWYRDFFNQADLVFCDGFGVLLAARIHGHHIVPQHRMTCPDYIEDLARACASRGQSLFLLAGRPGIVEQAIVRLQQAAPGLRINGHHGYFAKTGPENDQVIAQINAFHPDILYIGFGMPLQERWIIENRGQVQARVFLPLGACLDFYTGVTARGPQWATSSGFEWLTRLLTEPGRLWRRYLVGNPLFLLRVILERLHLRNFGNIP